ncbi:hypothetical protein D3C72_2292590 [compost metagenome]
MAHGFHGLGLDRQDDNVGALDGVGVVGEQFNAVLGVDFRPLLGTRITGADLRGIQTLGPQAADQAGGHVAGADKGNTSLAHVRSFRKKLKKA